ncbi:hypothetical protein ACFOJ6_03890 [Gordonia humi]|uniref:hypothetical protein n=1 Tax=Gordonia humi TaxID=686429 RepID=UPI00360A3656
MSVDWMIVTVPTDRDIDPANELAAAVRALGERRPDIEFRTAVLTGGGTTVTEALDAAADAGARTVLVQSAQTVDDRASNAWFRRVIGHWVREHTDGPHVRLGPSFARTRAYVDLLAEAIDDGGVPARDTTAPLTSPAWEDVPAFSRHVLICRGPRCSARGSGGDATRVRRGSRRPRSGRRRRPRDGDRVPVSVQPGAGGRGVPGQRLVRPTDRRPCGTGDRPASRGRGAGRRVVGERRRAPRIRVTRSEPDLPRYRERHHSPHTIDGEDPWTTASGTGRRFTPSATRTASP